MYDNGELIPIGSIDVSPVGTTKAVLTNGGFLVVQHGDQFVTTEAAEAYANVRVCDALEKAAQICESGVGTHVPGMTLEEVRNCDEEAQMCADGIRTLIESISA